MRVSGRVLLVSFRRCWIYGVGRDVGDFSGSAVYFGSFLYELLLFVVFGAGGIEEFSLDLGFSAQKVDCWKLDFTRLVDLWSDYIQLLLL